MFRSPMNRHIIIAAVMGALAGAVPALRAAEPALQAVASKRTRRGLWNGLAHPNSGTYVGTKGANMTTARHKRQVRKARNVRRNRASNRGAR